jgi:RimJ/RimL family protein N-acetyltransferase
MTNIRTLTIHTPRLVLRPWQRSDLDCMAQWPPFPDPIDVEWNWPRVLHEQGTLNLFWAGRNMDPRRVEWTITQHDDTVVGHVGVRQVDAYQGNSALGIGFGYPYIGHGYGREALAAFLDQYFGALSFATLRLQVALHNTRALRLYQKLGFRNTHTFWHQPELLTDWSFFADACYDDVRHLFRWGQDGVYMQCVEMELAAHEWSSTSA